MSVRDVEQWHEMYGLKFGDVLKAKCYFCWKDLKEHEIVAVISLPTSKPSIGKVKIGDRGTVMMLLEATDGSKAYEVESVLEMVARNGSLRFKERTSITMSNSTIKGITSQNI